MADLTFSERIDARIAHIDAEIARVTGNATGEVVRLRETKALLARAKAHLNQEREELLVLLKREGIL